MMTLSEQVTSESTLLSAEQLKTISEEFSENLMRAHKNCMRNSWKTAHLPFVFANFPNVYYNMQV